MIDFPMNKEGIREISQNGPGGRFQEQLTIAVTEGFVDLCEAVDVQVGNGPFLFGHLVLLKDLHRVIQAFQVIRSRRLSSDWLWGGEAVRRETPAHFSRPLILGLIEKVVRNFDQRPQIGFGVWNAAAVSDAAGKCPIVFAFPETALKLFQFLMEQAGIILRNHKKFVSAISIASVRISMKSLLEILTCQRQYLVPIFMPKGVIVFLERV